MSLKVLIHAVDEASLTRARANARNLLAAAPDAQCEIVANAAAVAAALASPEAQTDALLRLCGNTLARNALSLPEGLHSVPAAVLHLAQRQAEGWAYIRA